MGVKDINVYVIVGKGFTKETVKKELKEEGYPHSFYFGNSGGDFKDLYLKHSDEVWCFGDCSKIYDYTEAKKIGKDIWIMG